MLEWQAKSKNGERLMYLMTGSEWVTRLAAGATNIDLVRIDQAAPAP
jgi:hypothetical protein